MSLFKSEQGKQEIFALYDEKLQEIGVDHESMIVDTSFGPTHILIAGDASHPPIILVHGSNACAPIALESYPDLHKTHRVYAVDVLAQPNKSAETRLSMKDDSYGKWMNEIIGALKLESVTIAGFSFGGLVILKTLEHDESRISEVYLSAPAYIVNGNPFKAIFKMFIPMKRYMKTRNIALVEKVVSELFTEKDPFAVRFMSKVFVEFDMDFTPVPVINTKKAAEIRTPITLFAAKNDLLFPGEKMLKRARKIFPSLTSSMLIEDSRHVQTAKHNRMIVEVIRKG
jgi:pimeloyl-ACP methyl ester carboxylesterase